MKPTTVRVELENLASLLVNFSNDLDSVQVVYARVNANLVQDGDTGPM